VVLDCQLEVGQRDRNERRDDDQDDEHDEEDAVDRVYLQVRAGSYLAFRSAAHHPPDLHGRGDQVGDSVPAEGLTRNTGLELHELHAICTHLVAPNAAEHVEELDVDG